MQLPGPVRAAVGLAAIAADEARHLPDRAIELPMLAVSTALQVSLRAQQRYARLTARGDDLLNHRAPGEEPPAWATFDEPIPVDELRKIAEAPAAPAAHPARPARKAPPRKQPARKQAPRKTVAAKRTAAARSTGAGKTVHAPRNGAPSRFDAVGDDTDD